MSDPRIGVVLARDRHPAAKKLADLLDADTAGRVLCDEHLPLSEALSRDWPEDAHFLCYVAVDEDGERVYARVSKRSPFVAGLLKRGGAIEVGVITLDHDLPGKAEWTDASLGEFIARLSAAGLPSPTYWHSTLHGSRFIYVLSKPVDHLRAESLCRSMIARFRMAGVMLDEACADWTRLFRLPRTVREDSGQGFALTSEHFMLLDGGPTLDPDSIAVAPDAPSAESFAAVSPYEGEMPIADEVRELLVTRKENGREYLSNWAKTARQYLQGREAFAVCFEDALIDSEQFGGRNNALTKLAGQVVGMTASQENASPEGSRAARSANSIGTSDTIALR